MYILVHRVLSCSLQPCTSNVLGKYMIRYIKKSPICFGGFLALIFLLSCFCGLMLGYVNLSACNVWSGLLFPRQGDDITALIWDLRLPRVILAAAAGMGLSLSGVVMQAMFRNPMAGPYIMGVSSGAALGVVMSVFLGVGAVLGAGAVGTGAFCGALVLSFLIASMAGQRQGNPSFLLILGVALSAVCSGLTSVIIFAGANSSGIDVTLYWMMGSVAFAKLASSSFLLLLVILISMFFISQSRVLNLMMEGEESAIPLGIRLLPFIRLYLIINAILVGAVVMEAGLVGFVGLIVPHFVRMVIGAEHRRVLPLSVICGGILTVWADIAGRCLIPGQDIPIGVMLAFIGAPVFVGMLLKKTYRFGGEQE